MFKFNKKINPDDLVKYVYSKKKLVRYAQFLVGVLLLAIAFNLFMLPSQVVYGISGVGIILNNIFNVDASYVILVGSLLLLLLSFATLGFQKSKNTIVGSILYPIMVKLTEDICSYVDIGSAEPLVIVLFGAVLCGFGAGLVFKSGFTTGGTDILNQIVAKYRKKSIGNAMLWTDGLIVISGVFVFGWTKLMYSLISLYIISIMADKVILGISQSKAFYIITNNDEEIKQFIMRELNHGVTTLEGHGGFTGKHQPVLMCIVPTSEYFVFKECIHSIDPQAFFVVTDSYEVYGGA